MANRSWVFYPHYEISLGCLGFSERDQDVIIKPAAMRLKCGAHVNSTKIHKYLITDRDMSVYTHQRAGLSSGTMPQPLNQNHSTVAGDWL